MGFLKYLRILWKLKKDNWRLRRKILILEGQLEHQLRLQKLKDLQEIANRKK